MQYSDSYAIFLIMVQTIFILIIFSVYRNTISVLRYFLRLYSVQSTGFSDYLYYKCMVVIVIWWFQNENIKWLIVGQLRKINITYNQSILLSMWHPEGKKDNQISLNKFWMLVLR